MEWQAYDDRDGFIWMDGKLVEWRSANVHILTHALHYASSVFEGERCYNGKIFKGHEHSLRLLESGRLLDMPIPYTAEEIDAAKEEVLKANGLTDAYVRAVAFRGAGDEMGVASLGNPVRLAIACWSWGAYYGDAKMKGAKLDIAKWKRPSPETIPTAAKAAGLYMICTMSKHAAMAKGCSDALILRLPRLCGRGDRRQHLLRQGRRGAHPEPRLHPERHHPADRDRDAARHADQGPRTLHQARGTGDLRTVLADRHRGRGHAGGPDRRLPFRGRRPDPPWGRCQVSRAARASRMKCLTRAPVEALRWSARCLLMVRSPSGGGTLA
jgi:hypothetical protein